MKHLILLLFLALNTSAYSQAPKDWAWLYGATNAAATSITTTPNGDMYVFGRFNDTATFGSKKIASVGGQDVFLAKINTAGALVWLKPMGSYGLDKAYAARTYNDAIYIYGGFSDTLLLGNNVLVCKGYEDVFVAKLDTSGNFIWAQSGGSAGKEFIYEKGMILDKKGNVYITGNLWSNQPIIFGNQTISNNPYGGVFIVKYNSSGYTEWALCGANDSGHFSAVLDIKADENDNVYITGGYNGKITFNSATTTGNTITAGYDDAFLVKYNPAGNVVWANTISGNSDVLGTAVCCDKNNNVFLTGEATGTLTFGSITSPGSVPGRNTEFFLAKYDSSGNALWAKRAGTHGSTPIYMLSKDIICDNAGAVYWTGGRGDSLDFYSNGIIANTPIKNGGGSVFVAKHDANGNALWSIEGGGRASAEAMELHFYNQSLYVAGGFYPGDSIRFGSLGFKALGANNENLFIAKIANATGINSVAHYDNNISIYPNPTENYFTVSGISKGATISIYDMAGRCMQTHIAGADNEKIETNRLVKGNYTVVVTHSKESGTSYYKLTKL